ncbi:secretin N-terminal domain-containing protein [Deinococcus lacus]|uniref:Secretin N-terminal domain-containing protein n=1 Tax=Deinococcus lacus TaxID=392561 RepID=A0ABW1YBI9_9DEIO
MKIPAVLFLTAALGMAGAQSPAQPQSTMAVTATQAADPQLSEATITVETGRYNGPLSSLLAAIAQAAGYELVLEVNVDTLSQGTDTAGRPVAYSFSNKPFNEVWPLLMDVYGLNYQVVNLGGQPVLRVGNTPVQRIVTLENANPVQAANQVKLFFGTPVYTETPRLNEAGQTVGVTRSLIDVKLDSPTLRIIPDERLRGVIIRGTNREVAEVQRLLTQLDQSEADQAAANSGRPTQQIYAIQGAQADVEAVLRAQYPTLNVTPVPNAKQLVLSGPQGQVQSALQLLAQVDAAPGSEVAQRVYRVNSGAEGAITELTSFLKAQYPGLQISTIASSRQLILAGQKSQIDAAVNMLGELDPASESTTVQRVFQLVNASAEEVKATLEGTLAREVTAPAAPVNVPVNVTTPSGGSTTIMVPNPATQNGAATATQATQTPTATTSQMATIIADRRTNTLVVRGTPTQVAQVAELIPQLDQVVPQVNVQVRIQEVTQQAVRNLGLDWNASFGNFNVAGGRGGLTASFDPTVSFVGFNIFPTLTALESQGLTRRVYNGNITMQSGQRKLNATTNTQNASADAAATLKTGGRLEINIPSAAGNIIKQIDYGVNLDFFDPQVAPDGTITMRVRGQVNNPRTPISELSNFNFLDFTNSEAQSTITFKDGETVMLGGLLATTELNNDNGVPYLSSIPVIGSALGRQERSKTETQLLVIVTGNIVR